MEITKDLVAASATPMILSILSRGESYGYAIIKEVRMLSSGQMSWTDGMLYPVLHRLEKQELVESTLRKSESGRKRKYYKLKESGLKSLQSQKEQWNMVNSVLQKLWESKICLT